MSEELQEQYVTDADGNRVAAIVPLAIYGRLLDAWEDVTDLAAIEEYEAAKASGGDLDTIPFDQLVAEYDASQSRLVDQ